jgi:hypothetical protein
MKRIALGLILALLWGGNAFAECVQGNCENGQGTQTFPSGDKYVGEFKDSARHGKGTYTWSSGHTYVGEWKDNKRNGLGTYTSASGDQFVGEFKNNIPYGRNRAKEVAETKITSLKCKDFGYVEGTEKFADCMLELTKLKLKQQQQQQQQSSSNDTGVSDAMREANRIARAKALIQLGERLGRPPATSVMPFPKQQNCKLNPLNNRIVCN